MSSVSYTLAILQQLPLLVFGLDVAISHLGSRRRSHRQTLDGGFRGVLVAFDSLPRFVAMGSVVALVVSAIWRFMLIDPRSSHMLDQLSAAMWILSWILAWISLIRLPRATSHRLSIVSPVQILAVFSTALLLLNIHVLLSDGKAVPSWIAFDLALSLAVALSEFLMRFRHSQEVSLQREHILRGPNRTGIVPPPEDDADLFEILSFSWMGNIIKRGSVYPLTKDDFYELIASTQAQNSTKRFTEEFKPRYEHLATQLFAMEFRNILFQLLCGFVEVALTFNGPFCLYHIMDYIQNPSGRPVTVGLFYVVLSWILSVLYAVSDGQIYYTASVIQYEVRSVLIAEIFSKSLRHVQSFKSSNSNSKDNDGSSGKIISLMSIDTENVANASNAFMFALTCPTQIIITIVSLYSFLGWSAFAGIAIMIFSMPMTSILSRYMNRCYESLMEATDQRNASTVETLQAIRIIKFFAWEPQFLKKIGKARDKELACLIKSTVLNGFSVILWNLVPILVAIATFFTFTVFSGRELDAKTAFTCLALFGLLNWPLTAFPDRIAQILSLLVSVRRIEAYLSEPELERYSLHESHIRSSSSPEFSEASFEWCHTDEEKNGRSSSREASDFAAAERSDETTPLLATRVSGIQQKQQVHQKQDEGPSFRLRNVSLTFPHRKLTTICGSTGAGKSSLISALLGELKCIHGEYHLMDLYSPNHCGQIALVAQMAWLLNATIRDNILFGQHYDPDRYARVLHACCLVKDLDILEAGDMTEVGEKGINLSGGQKQRISLARAAYSFARVILLDDPLSAVDAPTARHLFEECIVDFLQDRTRILVTHAVNLALPKTDRLVVMSQGQVLAADTVSNVLKLPDIERILAIDRLEAVSFSGDETGPSSCDVSVAATDAPNHAPRYADQTSKLVSDETIQTGSVKLEIYAFFLQACGGAAVVVVYLLGLAFERGFQVWSDYWLKVWSDAYGAHPSLLARIAAVHWSVTAAAAIGKPSEPTAETTIDIWYYLSVYVLLKLGVILSIIGLYAFTSYSSYRASKALHQKLIARVLHAPIRWFDTTPLGRISNRLSKDMASIDREVLHACTNFLGIAASACMIIAVIGSITPVFLVSIPFIAWIYYRLAVYFLRTSRQLKRLHSSSRSPIYSSFSECLTGAVTIRAFGHEDRFMQEHMARIDQMHRAERMLWTSNRWFAMRLGMITGLVVLFAGASIIWSRDLIGAGLAGLSLSWASTIADNLSYLVGSHTQMELSMNSVERVHEYLSIEQESAAASTSPLPSNWPARGHIRFQDVKVKYSPELPLALRGITVDFGEKSRIAIVGRTGSGKSTLALSLFRMLECEAGTILIDGVDISTLGLSDLRRKMTIIPQEPVLFSGTVRSNLDPFDEHVEDDLWESLRRVRFLQTLQRKEGEAPPSVIDSEGSSGPRGDGSAARSGFSLNFAVAEGGRNLSVGQRQLLVLARVLLKRSSIIVLDEATASVDTETDNFIQETIRGPEFSDSTVLCIAHRIRTIVDYDRVLVLGQGAVVEYGAPYELMQSPGGVFRSMCVDTGEFEELEKVAKGAHLRASI
ncbi:uncharacterized protein BJ171DRAFT_454466 [Polychytrium aggregatum]|uniref:uncharacterized protein n=1 Tax=Polychytrium aggregatum TaxID=110093 RepID=UPI0022FEC105|nr:uncharacterized protein BJ171DRAFT_454466 [Polychytrium aggregatum]KAI9209496.1 hypothetical protein BJ171DRAFT_454466 [Polychytrium aggregatum]